jgi:hypothetical protein
VLEAVQRAISQREDMRGGVLIIDDSGDEKYGESGVGVAQQYNSLSRSHEKLPKIIGIKTPQIRCSSER